MASIRIMQNSVAQRSRQWQAQKMSVRNQCRTNAIIAHVSQSMIKMYSIEQSLEKFYNRNNDSFRQRFNREAFKSKYCSEDAPGGSPFRSSRVLEDDAGEWVQVVRFFQYRQVVHSSEAFALS